MLTARGLRKGGINEIKMLNVFARYFGLPNKPNMGLK